MINLIRVLFTIEIDIGILYGSFSARQEVVLSTVNIKPYQAGQYKALISSMEAACVMQLLVMLILRVGGSSGQILCQPQVVVLVVYRTRLHEGIEQVRSGRKRG